MNHSQKLMENIIESSEHVKNEIMTSKQDKVQKLEQENTTNISTVWEKFISKHLRRQVGLKSKKSERKLTAWS